MSVAGLRVPRQPPNQAVLWNRLVDVPDGGMWPAVHTTSAHYNGNTYIGFIDINGNVRVASYDHAADTVTISPSIMGGFNVDLHTAPGVLVRSSDHKILVAFCQQGTNHMYIALSSNAEDVSAWGSPSDIEATLAGGGAYTYPNLSQLSSESGKIYLHYRDLGSGNKLAYSTSTNGGTTWTSQSVLYEPTNSPFWNFDTDDSSRIDFLVSDGTIVNGDTASIYHFYYSGGSYFQSDGTLITGGLPIAASSMTKIYDGATNGSLRQPFGIVNQSGSLFACWAAANTAGWSSHPENYWYGVFSSGSWTVNKINDAGVVPGTLSEAGVVVDRTDPTKVYLGRSSAGNYQMFLYATTNQGTSWTATQLTSDGGDTQNSHPVSPHNAASGLRCVWSGGVIAPDTVIDFACQIRGYPNSAAPF